MRHSISAILLSGTLLLQGCSILGTGTGTGAGTSGTAAAIGTSPTANTCANATAAESDKTTAQLNTTTPESVNPSNAYDYLKMTKLFNFVKSNLSLPNLELTEEYGSAYRLYLDPEVTFDGRGIVASQDETRPYKMYLEYAQKDSSQKKIQLSIYFYYNDPELNAFTYDNFDSFGNGDFIEKSYFMKYDMAFIRVTQKYYDPSMKENSDEYYLEQQKSASAITEEIIKLLKKYRN